MYMYVYVYKQVPSSGTGGVDGGEVGGGEGGEGGGEGGGGGLDAKDEGKGSPTEWEGGIQIVGRRKRRRRSGERERARQIVY
jgi:hypothetical protein